MRDVYAAATTTLHLLCKTAAAAARLWGRGLWRGARVQARITSWRGGHGGPPYQAAPSPTPLYLRASKAEFQSTVKQLIAFVKDKPEYADVAPIFRGHDPVIPKAIEISETVRQGMAHLPKAERKAWEDSARNANVKAFLSEVEAYNKNAADLYMVIKTAISDTIQLEMINTFGEQFAPHIMPRNEVMHQPKVLWDLVTKIMSAPQDGNQFVMALSTMRRLGSIKQEANESMLQFAQRVELEVNRAKEQGIDFAFEGSYKDQYAMIPNAIQGTEGESVAKSQSNATYTTTMYKRITQMSPEMRKLKQDFETAEDNDPHAADQQFAHNGEQNTNVQATPTRASMGPPKRIPVSHINKKDTIEQVTQAIIKINELVQLENTQNWNGLVAAVMFEGLETKYDKYKSTVLAGIANGQAQFPRTAQEILAKADRIFGSETSINAFVTKQDSRDTQAIEERTKTASENTNEKAPLKYRVCWKCHETGHDDSKCGKMKSKNFTASESRSNTKIPPKRKRRQESEYRSCNQHH